jgi:hypothetical protein
MRLRRDLLSRRLRLRRVLLGSLPSVAHAELLACPEKLQVLRFAQDDIA